MAVELKPLMPKATAVWLVDNTSLTFEQIADFCGLHPLEVKGIADEDVAKGIKGQDPVTSGQLSREQIEEAEKDPKKRLKMAPPKHKMPAVKQKKAPRYTPVSKRQDKPDAVYWIIRNHPEFTDADIVRLIGTTKATIQKIRERSHWNATNIKAVDPVTLGLCSQLELDLAVTRATQKRERAIKRAAKKGDTLKSVSETTGEDQPAAEDAVASTEEASAEDSQTEEPAEEDMSAATGDVESEDGNL
ncbi:MAG TPA: cell cycle transcriptional regulator TrcR [Rhizomicrobium sp.]|jgi:hypothetical protein|nr:cell cycle transcriptional regulator TrcR [Rhizomicrobium sp.]